jgi:Mg-chelatase subunit ChlD
MSVRLLLDVLLVAAVAGAARGIGTGSGFEQEPPQPQAQEQGDAASEDASPEPVVLDREETANLVATWTSAQHWTVRGLVIVSLGESWSPEAAPMLLEALTGKRKELAAFALERLRTANDMCLWSSATKEIVAHLVDVVRADRDEYVAGCAQELLERIFPSAGCAKRSEWQAHWKSVAETYRPERWTAPPPKPADGPQRTVAGAVGRALDLREAGLELCFCVDASGSMQPMLDATAGAAQELTALLEGFAPQLRVGAVYFKDHGDLPGGAALLEALTNRHTKVFRAIGELRAAGGGDIPEAVDRGLATALDPTLLDWSLTANKLVVVMGDAPPHQNDVATAVELASLAARVGIDRSRVKQRPTSGPITPSRPVVVSCIAVASGKIPSATREAFEEIANAGGGAYAALTLGGGEAASKLASQGIVRQVLRMAFGSRWEDEVDEFLDVYFDYRERGWFD